MSKVFINYRRADTAAFAGRLFDMLSDSVGSDRIFFDFDIQPGADFAKTIDNAIASADVVLVVIGRDWLENGRLDDPHDFVRLEIETALRLDKVVVPVLADDAHLPAASALPESLVPLTLRQAVPLRHERFRADAQSLVRLIERALAEGANEEFLSSTSNISQEQSSADAGWDAISDSAQPADFRDFIARYPDAENARLAQQKLEQLRWAELKEAPSTEAFLAFLSEFPDGTMETQAREWLAGRLEGIRNEFDELEERKAQLEHEMRLIVGPDTEFRNDIFVSYSKTEPKITMEIVSMLEAAGYKVWWDTNLVSGDEFSDVIRRELVGSRAVVVIWTQVSVKSKWVKAEAQMADFDDKLVPVRPRTLDPREIPLPFNIHHCEFADDHDSLIKALKKKGVHPTTIGRQEHMEPQVAPSTLPETTSSDWWAWLRRK